MEAEKTDVTIISPRRIRTEYALGDGSYGIVYKAMWTVGKGVTATETDVAIKIPKNPVLKDHAWTEVTRMSLLNHPNILSLHGITFPRGEDSAPWIVMEYMACGNLHSYIKAYPGGGMTSTVMVKFAYGIACGMTYLHHEMNQRHGDLAARNCLVGPQETVKIGDFGKFEDHDQNSSHDSDNNPFPCPLRWMAPENLPAADRPPRFTRKGDIYAFGIVLFEIWSKGGTPFQGDGCLGGW
ncbi:tyrosine-protein kinase receptor cam-1 isoform X2 [Folsomia candida]|uniref:tyrosine-protein kinase receptor cam-1 isoform X2 n=1 Tax=Folsomia candida TaxID=158441 RepID=UPI000B9046FB|nr:tyrosine-protein kinase receptor cam-1 isoform X2 [Folsomia candida]